LPNLSSITIAGHLGRDAELKNVGDSQVCSFSVAVTKRRKGNESTAWYACQLWGTRGERLAEHLTKGKAVIVVGELVPREYKGKKDEMRTSLDINVQTIEFAGGSSAGGSAGSTRADSAPASGGLSDEEEIPF